MSSMILKKGSAMLKNIVGLAAVALSLASGSSYAGNPLEDLVNKVQSDFRAINEKGEQDRARIRASGSTQSIEMAQGGGLAIETHQEESQSKPTQVIIPKDKRTAAAIDEAMPTIKKILALHRCLKTSDGLRQMNFDAVAGMDMMRFANPYDATIGLPIRGMQFHDKNKCLRIQSLDQWSMPALNALLFRSVYFADDSGEVANFLYLFMKTDDGSWKIKQFEPVVR